MILDKFLTDNDIKICVALGTTSCYVTLMQHGVALDVEHYDGTIGPFLIHGKTQEEVYTKVLDKLPGATSIGKFKVPK